MKGRSALWFLTWTCLAHIWFVIHPTSALHIYQQHLFPVFRIFFDHTWGRVNIPFLYILVVGMMMFLAINIRSWYLTEIPWKVYGKKVVLQSGKTILIFIALFFWLWGFHYYQPDFSDRLPHTEKTMDKMYLERECQTIVLQVNKWRNAIPDAALARIETSRDDLENEIRENLLPLLEASGWNTQGRVRVRSVSPKGVLLRFSAAGIYLPYSFEGHYDSGLHALQIPFTLAHEMAHGYGVTDEGDCNLLALMATLKSADPLVKYSGLLTYYRYLRNDNRSSGIPVLRQVNEQVRADLTAIRMNVQKYPDLFPFWRDYVYDWYLRILGVDGGVQSYYTLIDNFFKVKETKPDWIPPLTM